MDDNTSEESSPAAIARRLEVIAVELHDIEGHLPGPLSLASARRELTLTTDVCRRLADGPTETKIETADGQERDASIGTSEGPSGEE